MTTADSRPILPVMSTPPAPYFNEKISASVPRDLHAAAVEAALRQGLTLADFVRGAVQRQLAAEGIAHPAIPNLHRTTFQHRRGRL